MSFEPYDIELERHERKDIRRFAKSPKGAVKQATAAFPGWMPTSVDGIAVVGRCEACGDPVLEDEDYSVPDEMVCICESCRKGMSDD